MITQCFYVNIKSYNQYDWSDNLNVLVKVAIKIVFNAQCFLTGGGGGMY